MAGSLMFDAKYMNALLSGEKTATVRVVSRRIPKVGEELYVHCGGRVLGKVRVKEVVYKPLRELTDEDARIEGFASCEQLLAAVRKHYPGLKLGDLVAVIRFEWVERYPDLPTSEEFAWGMKFDPQELAKLALKECRSLTERERRILKLVVESGSIRGAAHRLGGIWKRRVVRRALRKALMELRERGLVGSERGANNNELKP